MEIKNKRFLVIGGAGLIGSHTVDLLLKEKVKEILIFDNFCRGRIKNLEHSLKDKRVKRNIFLLFFGFKEYPVNQVNNGKKI